MLQYHALLSRLVEDGDKREDRTGTGTLSVFGHQMRFNLAHGFPLVTTKRVSFHNIKAELLWMLAGNKNVSWLQERKVTIWDEWAFSDGSLGPIYGHQWRSWPQYELSPTVEGRFGGVHTKEIDQIAQAIHLIKNDPTSRRIVVSAWNVSDLHSMALPPCHAFFQFFVSKGKLSCQLYQRSADVFLGVPYNIASYSLLTHMVAQVCGLKAGEFIWTGGDCHLYLNHLEQAKTQLSRKSRPLPSLVLNPDITGIDDFDMDDIAVEGYDPHPAIKGDISV